jgi:Dolichyl-phosphate-mannose-protein mannosyltransferase
MNSPQPAQASEVAACLPGISGPKRSISQYFQIFLCFALFAEIAVACYNTRSWPLYHDSPLIQYFAFLIGRGRVPYRDFIDMNMPGTYWSSLLAIHVFGAGDLGWRLYDFALLLVGIAALWVITKPAGKLAFALASSMIVTAHLAGGAIDVGQRDFQAAILELAACAFFLLGVRKNRALWFVLCGVACGLGVTIKPPALLFAAAFAAALLLEKHVPARRKLRFAAYIMAGVSLPLLAVIVYLAKIGALPSFWLVCRKFIPFYASLAHPSLKEMNAALLEIGLWKFNWLVRIPAESFRSMLLAVLIFSIIGVSKVVSRERYVLAMGAVCGAISFYGQWKGWRYHLYPLFFFFLAYLAITVVPILRDARLWKRALAWIFIVGWSFFAATAHIESPYGHMPPPRSRELMADISSLRAEGHDHGIQMMDQTLGGFDAMYRLQLEQATSAIYDFQFFNKENDPYVQGLRASWLKDMSRAQPDLIVMSIQHWPQPDSFDRLKTWPEFEQFLSENYLLTRQTSWYRIYVRNRSSLQAEHLNRSVKSSPLPVPPFTLVL